MTAINSNRAIRGPVTAVPVVAGKGVRLVADTDNNRWVVEADETVLWDGTETSTSVTLSETANNFEYIEIFYRINDGIYNSVKVHPTGSAQKIGMNVGSYHNSQQFIAKCTTYTLNGTSLGPTTAKSAMEYGGLASGGGSVTVQFENNAFWLIKVVGINRVSGGN